MIDRTSVRSARDLAEQSQSRSAERRDQRSASRGRFGRWRRWRLRKRTLVVAGTVAVGVAVGVLIGNSDQVQQTLLEVTLPLRHEDIIRQQAADKGVPPELIAAVIYTESRFRDQTSSAGARGLMQLTPTAVSEIRKHRPAPAFSLDDLADPDINIRYGTYYLRLLLDRYDANLVAALAAYNAGETNVASWGGADLTLDDIQFDETRGYVEDVLDKEQDYAKHYSDELGLATGRR
jgi:soluble lytic murein transglycosylase